MRIGVAGATGVVGSYVVLAARERGHEVVPLARSLGVDLVTGDGLGARLAGVDAVVDVTSIVTQRRRDAEAFFGDVTRALHAAEHAQGVGHHVALSIVGIDRVATGYYQGKLLQERVVASGEVPWSILRATQFHEFAQQALGFVRLGPLSLVPRMTSQPVAAVEVAQVLVDLVEAGPSGRVADLAGPEEQQVSDLARRVARARDLHRLVVPVRVPGAAGRAMREGGLLPDSDGPRGVLTFDAWLAGGLAT